jgi:hypothetical protein
MKSCVVSYLISKGVVMFFWNAIYSTPEGILYSTIPELYRSKGISFL